MQATEPQGELPDGTHVLGQSVLAPRPQDEYGFLSINEMYIIHYPYLFYPPPLLVCVWGGDVQVGAHMCATVHEWKSEEDFQELFLFFHHVSSARSNSGCQAWQLCRLNHLISPTAHYPYF